MNRKKKGKYIGLAGALLVHVVVIALLILVGFTLPEQSEEGGVPVMMGEVPDAWGAADPSLVEVDVMPEETAPEMPEEVEQDEEGLQTMRTLGANMAWLLKCIEAGRAAGIDLPVYEPKVFTNFI